MERPDKQRANGAGGRLTEVGVRYVHTHLCYRIWYDGMWCFGGPASRSLPALYTPMRGSEQSAAMGKRDLFRESEGEGVAFVPEESRKVQQQSRQVKTLAVRPVSNGVVSGED